MDSLTITIPLPPNAVRPNARVHYMAKARATKKYRGIAWAKAREAWKAPPPMWQRATFRVVAYSVTATHQDPDNLIASCKAVCDGLQDAGIVANDKALFPVRPEFKKDPTNPRLEITILEEP